MTLQPVSNPNQIGHLQGLDTLAIDLGFATQARSCGLSTIDRGVTFERAVTEAANWIQHEERAEEVVLILEAPLSGAFNPLGNPMARGIFETHHQEGHRSDRRWHIGAGGSMALAALFFLRRLLESTIDTNRTVHLVEGFTSRYGDPVPDDAEVARMLFAAWRPNPPARLGPAIIPPAPNWISSLRFLGEQADTASPLVLRLPDGLTRNDAPRFVP
jgi:hypothetical protein